MSQRTDKRYKPNYFYVVFSVSLLLFLLSGFGLLLLKTNRVFKHLKENIDLIVELKNDAPQSAIDRLKEYIDSNPAVKSKSYRFISKEEGARFLAEEFGEDFMLLGLPNPLYDLITFNVNADYMQRDSLHSITSKIDAFEIVNDVYYQNNMVNYITDNIQRITYAAIVISFILLLVVVVLIHNTVKLSLYSNRFLVKNMQLVGASWGFISRPYLKRSFWNGILSACLAIGLVFLTIYLLEEILPGTIFLYPIIDLILLIVVIFAVSILINLFSTYYTVNKYLKMRVDDLY